MSGTLQYVEGDVTRPIGDGKKVIAHICNNIGAWGAGVSGAIGRAFPAAETHYRNIFTEQNIRLPLGSTQFCYINDDLTVANMIGQHQVRQQGKRPPIRYLALASAMRDVQHFIVTSEGFSIHAPRFGAGLAGGKWETIEHLIFEIWTDYDIDVTIYDLPQG